MPKLIRLFGLVLIVVSCFFAIGGCGNDPIKPPPPLGKDVLLKAAVTKANTILDQLEGQEKEDRNDTANQLRFAETLKTASADPSVKARLEKLEITLK